MMMEKRGEIIKWKNFKTKFPDKYFLDNVRYAKKEEFLQLAQGSMLVVEYAKMFKHLADLYTLSINEILRFKKI